MATGFTHTCSNCSYSVSTSGPHEFYRDADGVRKPYGHPAPFSDEARERGIYGLSGALYCAKCDEVFDVILVEFEEPAQNDIMVWGGRCTPKQGYRGRRVIKCPKCTIRNLILIRQEGEEPMCPRCRRGRLIGRAEWIS